MNPTGWCQRAAIILAVSANLIAGAHAASSPRYRIEEVRPLWMKLDRNGDGVISMEELRAEDPALLSGFRKADLDRDGKLSLRELELLLISL
jgi:Ca2+-binding EF-hand superfamily protein